MCSGTSRWLRVNSARHSRKWRCKTSGSWKSGTPTASRASGRSTARRANDLRLRGRSRVLLRPAHGVRQSRAEAAVKRFWDKVDMSGGPNSCWNWTAFTQPAYRPGQLPYGKFRANGTVLLAHRVAFELAKGPIPDGHIVRHACDNPKCCNPAHLSSGTQSDNVGDAISRGRHMVPRFGRRGGEVKRCLRTT